MIGLKSLWNRVFYRLKMFWKHGKSTVCVVTVTLIEKSQIDIDDTNITYDDIYILINLFKFNNIKKLNSINIIFL